MRPRQIILLFLIIILVFYSTKSLASSFSDCSNIFYKLPKIDHQTLLHTTQLCNNNYAVLYSNIAKVPLYSYEKSNNTNTDFIKRNSNFKEDSRIYYKYRSSLSDYRYSGYDKGHLTPSGNMHTIEDQHSTFLLSNIAPQAPKLNQKSWRYLENKVKDYPYKVTGTLFTDTTIIKVGNVLVPTHFYKIVSNTICSKAYIAENTNEGIVTEISLEDLQKLININFNFPFKKCEN